MGNLFSQSSPLSKSSFSQAFPPPPQFTEENIPNQSGKVFIVTGASSGIGEQVADILFAKGAKVYIATRSEPKARAAIDRIKSKNTTSTGQLLFLPLDLADLSTIKSSAQKFLDANSRLDVLLNNAGCSMTPQGSITPQGYEMQLGTNCLGPFLFTQLLRPILAQTAKVAPADSVRVIWVSSQGAELVSPKDGVPMHNLDYHIETHPGVKYNITKAGNIYQSSELALRTKGEGIISLALNPGGNKSEATRHYSAWLRWLVSWFLYDPVYGAYTELFAALSPEVTASENGAYIIPWGRLASTMREDLVMAQKSEEEGGTGVAARFWDWCEEQVKEYV